MLALPFPAEPNGYSAALIDRMPVAVLFLDAHNQVLAANQSAAGLLGQSTAALAGQHARSLCASLADLLENTSLAQEINAEINCPELPGGHGLRVYLAPLREPSGQRLVMLWSLARRDPNPRLEIPITALFEAILESIKHGVLVADQEGLPVYHNPSLQALWDMPASVFSESGAGWTMLLSRRLKNPERLIRLAQSVVERPNGEMYDFLELSDGRVLECHSRLIYPVKGAPAVRVWSFQDITEQQRTERELHYLSTHDGLTGLYNRAFFEMQLRQLYTYPAFPVSMIMVDVDGLKKVNDRYGHPAGDTLLSQTAEVLSKACRMDDIVARLGGDEFGILLLRAGPEVADNVIERVQHLQTLQRIEHPEQQLSLSVGSATARSNPELAHLFSQADAEMYRTRRKKRSTKVAPRRYIRKDGD